MVCLVGGPGPVADASTPPTDPETSAPPTTEAVPLVPVPTGCDPPERPYIVFIGTVAEVDYRTTRFKILQIRDGRADPFTDDDMIDIRYGQDTQYLTVGETYLVGAGRDPALGILVSRVKPQVEDFGGDEVIGVSETDADCEKAESPLQTLYPDGSPIDAPLLQPIRNEWSSVLLSFGQPLLVALGVVFALALLRNGTRAAVRVARAEDR